MYIDLTSIRPQGKFMKAWSRFVFNAPQNANTYPVSSYLSVKAIDYYDCASMTLALKQQYMYEDADGMGKIVLSYVFKDNQLDFEDPIPGSAGDDLLRFVCYRKH